jgi:hypothetical protein
MGDNTTFHITDLHCKDFGFDKQYGIMKDSFDMIKSILTEPFGFHGILKPFSKSHYYDQMLFQKKGYFSEANVELDVNSLYTAGITNINLLKCNPTRITQFSG